MVPKTYNAENERLKRRYLQYARAAKRLSESSLDRIAASIDRFQSLTNVKSFSKFHVEQIVAFRDKLDMERNARTGKPISASLKKSVLVDCKGFFLWLADQPKYRRRIRYSDCDYFNLDHKSKAQANASRPKDYPSLDQIEHVLRQMPDNTPVEKRNRALIAFACITGARVTAIRTAKVGSIDPIEGVFVQDARVIETKFAKTFSTWFFPISELATEIFLNYYHWLSKEQLFGPGDPLFPSTLIEHVPGKGFQSTGLTREHWSNDQPIRTVFKTAFEEAGLRYYNPHSFRHTLSAISKARNQTLEEQQAWAQNLGQESALTMLQHYGKVPTDRQRDIIRKTNKS